MDTGSGAAPDAADEAADRAAVPPADAGLIGAANTPAPDVSGATAETTATETTATGTSATGTTATGAAGGLRIGELAARAGVSRRTVDFYTRLGLLTPARRSSGNFRLYHASDVQRITAIRRLEKQGIRLEDIAHVLSGGEDGDHTGCEPGAGEPCPADPVALDRYLASLDSQVHALRQAAEAADGPTKGVLTTLTARAHALIVTALIISEELLPEIHQLPPF